MACIPIYPPRGLEILKDHIKQARARREVQNMTTPLTYIWFYQRVRNRGPWDYKQKIRRGKTTVISITGRLAMQWVSLPKFYIQPLARPRGLQKHLSQHGGISCRGRRSGMTHTISFGLSKA